MSAKRSPAEIRIPFNQPFLTGRELEYISEAHRNQHLSGDGPFTRRCHAWLEHTVGCPRALLTHSCTAALEMAAILADIGPEDEVIMPSFTFVSTANAFVLRGGVPVFVDVREDTLNIDESKIEAAVTPRTRAIVVVHYAGVACEMDEIQAIASRHGLLVIEDAAQAVLASYKGTPLGGLGALGALSFHETKNILCGEGGALLVNDPRLVARAEVIREKGTDRSRFARGEIDKYTWVDLGSSFLPGEVVAAFLWAQMQMAETITGRRLAIWARYHQAFAELERSGQARRPVVPSHTTPNAHNYYLLVRDAEARARFMESLRVDGIHAVFHYVPLHDSPAGKRFGRASGSMAVTRSVADRLVRLPLWLGLENRQDEVIDSCLRALAARG
ncbi:MAG TPA: dTDP-4-amino-4,6-dideoxygalactose transaminase [Burkholderiales bacterium]|nr:dTDP-4-amino-4,6-dideoxygalactose transaminase [Burkholderiales bacterium]